MAKRVFYWIATILQILFLITAYGVQIFSMKKMGMMGYVVYINQQWEAHYPIGTLRNSTITFLLIAAVMIISYAFIRKDNLTMHRKTLSMLFVEVITTLAFVFFSLFSSTESYRSYYFTSLALGIIALIQDIKIIVYLKRYNED